MPPPDAQPSPTRVRRRVLYALVALTVLLALIFTPPLVSVGRYRHRIAQTMSDSLGRPVHIDDVKLHLLPLPSLELRNVVVSEDPAFGSEPTIRANRVVAILRPSSLWRRPIEFSTIRFAADENGSGPSINLVRNASGRWNLDSVLMQAAHVSTAPTDQRKAGPAPRFPYIEATAARVNLKLGQEKMPFSLTDAEFALWLPSPDQWHVRLTARPIRTDTTVSETGVVRLEGTLARAASIAAVPVDLQATWTGAQLGEATVLVTGQDMGWRGTGTLNAALRGPLADARLTSTLELQSLRRADFIPARTLEVTITCGAQATVTAATLEHPLCTLPAPLHPEPQSEEDGGTTAIPKRNDTGSQQAEEPTHRTEQPGGVLLQAARLDLTNLTATDLRLGIHATDSWLLDWARLFSPALAPDTFREGSPAGAVEGNFNHIPAAGGQPAFWNGQLQGTVVGVLPWHKSDEGGIEYPFVLQASPDGLDLAPVNLALPSETPLSLRGTFAAGGYTLRLAGVARPDQVYQLANILPPLAGHLSAVLPPQSPVSSTVIQPTGRIDLVCTRSWSAPEQTCTSGHPAEPPPRRRTGARPRHHS